jgi:SAM-dependent methyltransferase
MNYVVQSCGSESQNSISNTTFNNTIMFKQFFQTLKYKMMARQLRKPGGVAGIKTGKMMNKANGFLYEFTLDTMQPAANDSILEIGFGNGKFFNTVFARADNLHISGLDFSFTMVNAARENNRDLIDKDKLVLTQGSSNQMPFADNSFNKIFCINVIYFWDDPAQHLQEIKRVLKPRGQFFASIRTKESMALMPFTQYGFTSYTENSWNELLINNGLTPGKAVLINEPEIDFNGKPFRVQSMCLVATKDAL